MCILLSYFYYLQKEGVKVYILLYKEIEMAVGGIQSMKAKNNLENLHPNILVSLPAIDYLY